MSALDQLEELFSAAYSHGQDLDQMTVTIGAWMEPDSANNYTFWLRVNTSEKEYSDIYGAHTIEDAINEWLAKEQSA